MLKLNKNITLIGMPGAGKTAIAKELHKMLDCTLFDADEEIAIASNSSIADLFHKHGEESFRDGERRVIERILKKKGVVLSAGGGAYINENTRRIIEENSVSIWLDVSIGTLWQRVQRKKHRPMLQGLDAVSYTHLTLPTKA